MTIGDRAATVVQRGARRAHPSQDLRTVTQTSHLRVGAPVRIATEPSEESGLSI